MNRVSLILFLFILGIPVFLHGQEEVIISSDNIEEAEQNRKKFKVKPRYRYVDSTQQRSLIKIAFQPEFSKFPGQYDFSISRARGMGRSLVIGYERLLKNHQFSLFVENTIRLYSTEGSGYDYANKFRFQDGSGNNLNRGGEYDANMATFDIGAKFYYRQRKKVEYGASGINPFNEYLFFRVKDVLSFTNRTTIVRSINSGFLERHVEEKKWIANPGYVMLGWGSQRRVKNRLLIDVYAGLGVKVAGDRNHANRDVIWTLGLNMGIGLGKRNK